MASRSRPCSAFSSTGILTGIILALSRAIETAPLIMIGALTFVAFAESPMDEFTALLFRFLTGLPDQETFHELAAGGIIVLLAVLLLMNAVAVYIRYRGSKK